ncbi:hypothetical protein HQ393_10375 [Chitinibacter bivalviorum]|uniref:Uncharacterized protein n=1 Tax=Chitinibacter bivalviorum TaxID=2739434 RepID=A0A7H9BJG2_9NEIS|nr:hypothetical protein [Chitinibacter bivalviorum]QLG88609.1 hypothetical protein HQ393_10375 [Chitinibacter bivalviorum]
MSIAKKHAEQTNKFICMRDLIVGLQRGSEDAVSPEQVAQVLIQYLETDKSMPTIAKKIDWHDIDHTNPAGISKAREYLSSVAKHNTVDSILHNEKNQYGTDFGFLTDEIIKFLEEQDIAYIPAKIKPFKAVAELTQQETIDHEWIPAHVKSMRVLTATQAALAWAGIDPMQVSTLQKAEHENWTGWEEAKARKAAILQGLAFGELQAISAKVFIVRNSFGDGDEEAINPAEISPAHLDQLYEATFKTGDILKWLETSHEHHSPHTQTSTQQANTIRGDTFGKLAAAIAAFPDKYPNYQSNAPQSKAIGAWLVESFSCGNMGKNNQLPREAIVFCSIIKEHFDLK